MQRLNSRRTRPLPGALLLAVLLGCNTEPEPKFRFEEQVLGTANASRALPLWSRRVQLSTGAEGEDLYPCLSPDGKTLYYSSSRFTRNYSLVARTLDAHGLSYLTSGEANDIQPAVSPDGARLAFSTDRDGHWEIYLLELGSREPVRPALSDGVDTLGPRWSPGGNRLVCFRPAPGQDRWGIWILDLESGTRTYLTAGLFPAWSPDGKWICFQRARQRGERWYSIWKISADGGRATELTASWNDRWGAVHPAWSPDGRWIVFTAVDKSADSRRGGTASQDLYLLSSDGAHLTNLTGDRPGISEWNPHFGADWKIYFTSDQEGSHHIWSLDSRKVTPGGRSRRPPPCPGWR